MQYIAEFYHEDPEAFSKEVHALETLRNQAMRTTKDGAPIMKRYYCQLHALQNRFPQLAERSIFTFTWKDLYHSTVHEVSDIRYERAAVLFNIAASHTQSGASVTRGDVDGMKMACTHFQVGSCAPRVQAHPKAHNFRPLRGPIMSCGNAMRMSTVAVIL